MEWCATPIWRYFKGDVRNTMKNPNKTPKPSELKLWNEIEDDTTNHSTFVCQIKPSIMRLAYGYYLNNDGKWQAHRLPTIKESFHDSFN